MMGRNKSIWFPPKSIERLELIIAEYERQIGVKLSDSAVVCRAIDSLFLSLHLTDKLNSVQEIEEAA